ncbi:hypothetical protein E3P99_00281 [Wallemia hederae]|uniref:UBC core domain-containing protein n=1 Tax=Wallemia hederae TaxID=1540922 RepID=A0A4T0FW60_9BASI|nr:hypothetical protein E3P99_00281 [Wallemia hederae]
MKELATMQQQGCPPYTYARPEESNILNWHFVFLGSEDTAYQGGEYHGVLEFPKDYPFSPPHIKFHTPSGRFKPNTSICTSFSDFHKDTWNPMLSVSTILTSLLSFFNEDAVGTGGMTCSQQERRQFAAASKAFNRDKSKNFKFSKVFDDLLHPESGEMSLDDILLESTKEKKPVQTSEDSEGKEGKESKDADKVKGAGGDNDGDRATQVDKPLSNLSLGSSSGSTKDSSTDASATTTSTSKPAAKKGSAMSRFRAKVKNSGGEDAKDGASSATEATK